MCLIIDVENEFVLRAGKSPLGNNNTIHLNGLYCVYVGLLGIEPSLYAPEAYVLPVYDSPNLIMLQNSTAHGTSSSSLLQLPSQTLLFVLLREAP